MRTEFKTSANQEAGGVSGPRTPTAFPFSWQTGIAGRIGPLGSLDWTAEMGLPYLHAFFLEGGQAGNGQVCLSTLWAGKRQARPVVKC